jgi:hypothetical protein
MQYPCRIFKGAVLRSTEDSRHPYRVLGRAQSISRCRADRLNSRLLHAVGVKRGVKCPANAANIYVSPANLRLGPSRKPDSALSRHPSPGGEPPELLLEEPRLPVWESQTIWLARTGCLPGRPLAGYRRWALTPPFHPSPVPPDMHQWGMSARPSAGLLSVALDVAAGLRHTAPRVVSPSGLSGSGAPGPRESGLCSALPAELAPPGGAATGRTARTQDLDYTSDPPGSRPFTGCGCHGRSGRS